MGSAFSTISSHLVASLLVAVGTLGLGLGYALWSIPPPPSVAGTKEPQGSKKKKKKKAKAGAESGDAPPAKEDVAQAAAPAQVVAFPEVIPGQFDTTVEPASELGQSQISTAGESKKTKKKKQKAKPQEPEAPAPVPPAAAAATNDQKVAAPSTKAAKPKSHKTTSKPASSGPSPIQEASASFDTDGSWTRVETRRKAGSNKHALEASTSDAGITTSVTGNSSPAAEQTEDEAASPNPRDSGENRRTLAEKLLPKPRKTGVEDLLDTPDVPTLSRVMRIKPGPDENPASGFSWGDYEDVRVADGGENDAGGEDDGRGVVKSRNSESERQASSGQARQSTSSTPEPASKKQRQNAQKRDAQKVAKAADEEERLAALARHKRELERLRMAEQVNQGKKVVSGKMKATVDDHGKLVWE